MVQISVRDYFGPHSPAAVAHLYNAKELLAHVNPLLSDAVAAGIPLQINPVTGTLVSGATWGGYRTQACPEGAPRSAHKEGQAVDVFDLGDALDAWLTDAKLEKYGLYREHPDHTAMKPGQIAGWCHLTTRAPGSGARSYHI